MARRIEVDRASWFAWACLLWVGAFSGCENKPSGESAAVDGGASATAAAPSKASPVQRSATGEAAGEPTGGVAEAVAVNPDEAQPAEAPGLAGEPAATPARESLQLLASKGASEVASIRSERKSIYRIFGTFTPEQQKDVAQAVALAQRIQWDERPEKLAAAPAELHAAVKALLPLAAKYMDSGTEKLRQFAELEKEVQAGKKPNQKKMDKLQGDGSGELKVGRQLGFLVRSLLNETEVFARHGSMKMRADMREMFGPMKGQPLPVDQAEDGLAKLFEELNISSAE